VWKQVRDNRYNGYIWKNGKGDVISINSSYDVGVCYVTLTEYSAFGYINASHMISPYIFLRRKPVGIQATMRRERMIALNDSMYGTMDDALFYAKRYMKSHK
jgi:hypothetical protein